MPKKETKPPELRRQETQRMRDQLHELGLGDEHPGIQEFFRALDDFNKGYSSSGRIRLTGLKRHLEYVLSLKPHIQSSLVLRYDPFI